MSKVHALKTWPKYFAVVGNSKTFEVRKNDRNFKVGDVLWLQEWVPETEEYTGRSKKFTISFILMGGQFGIEEGYCVMGLGPTTETSELDKLWNRV